MSPVLRHGPQRRDPQSSTVVSPAHRSITRSVANRPRAVAAGCKNQFVDQTEIVSISTAAPQTARRLQAPLIRRHGRSHLPSAATHPSQPTPDLQIPIAVPRSRGFLPWRLSDADPACVASVREGPASETLHRSGHSGAPRLWLRASSASCLNLTLYASSSSTGAFGRSPYISSTPDTWRVSILRTILLPPQRTGRSSKIAVSDIADYE